MSALILNRTVVANDITFLDDEAAVPASGKAVVSLARWQQQSAELRSAAAEIGVRLPNTVDVATIWNDLKDRKLIVVDFPGFGDGRAYSQARLLRDRYDFKGDIVATGGAVVRDQMLGMQRSGINGFLLRADQAPEVCLTAFHDFTSAYQRASDREMPIVREQRRNSAA
jgi:uncharacterized protein (DUF934 family)